MMQGNLDAFFPRNNRLVFQSIHWDSVEHVGTRCWNNIGIVHNSKVLDERKSYVSHVMVRRYWCIARSCFLSASYHKQKSRLWSSPDCDAKFEMQERHCSSTGLWTELFNHPHCERLYLFVFVVYDPKLIMKIGRVILSCSLISSLHLSCMCYI